MKRLLLFFCPFVILLSGCWDVTEPQRMYYVNGVGVDYKDNQYEIYLQLINFSNVAKTETPSPEASPAEIGHATGKTIEEAIYKLYRSVDQEIFWGHMTYLLFSEEALKSEHANSVLDTFIRFRETRYQIHVHCTQDSIEEILLVSPILDKSLPNSKLSNPLNTSTLEAFTRPVDLRKLIIGLNEPSHEVALSLVSINKNWVSETENPSDETAINGVCVLSKDGYKGVITNNLVGGNRWMTGQKSLGNITFKLENNESDYITVDIEKLDLEVIPIVKRNQVTFEIDIDLEAIINGFNGNLNVSQLKKGIEKKVKEEIKTTYEEGLNLDVDIYRLSEYLYRDNVKAWKRIEKDGKVPLSKDSISKITINVNKIHSGRKVFKDSVEE
ncbi:Ger(x)C family spore germination protein [Lysinibacillus sp. 1P01SD]|uniref:Ger(x)C family spore germination protein n=1 Tax=Lysinibacillus TaxID=400634 RepID=UPI0038888592